MIRLEKITKHIGGRTLFEDIGWEFTPGRCFGLVGPNGAGKTTLFRIISGDLDPDGGRVIVPRGMTVGVLPQTVGELADGNVLDTVLAYKAEIIEMEQRLHALQKQLENASTNAESAELSAEYGELEARFGMMGGYSIRADAQAILAGMGFAEEDMDRDVHELSGGWRMRLVLSGLLLQRPSVLLMDEPTNHLDVPSLEWLEGFLGTYEGTVVLISHDRYFLNRLVDEIASLEPDGLHITPGNYDKYELARAEREADRERRIVSQQKEIAQIEDFIDRFRSKASKAKQVQSRVKMLEKMERVESVQQRKQVHISFPAAPRSGQSVAKCSSITKAYGDNVIYDGLDFEISRGERVAFVGPNGQGKSTLLKMLAGRLEPDSGDVSLGHNVVPAFFAQHHIDGLDLNQTILSAMEAQATSETFPRCRSILGAFLFSGDDVEKRVSVLSGGEKHRVALATLLLKPTNLLLLDEPTNHLDIQSRDVLKDALASYEGTVIFVSHDRAFLNGLATRVVHIEDREVTNYLGDYDYYAYRRGAELETQATEEQETTDAAVDGATLSRKEQRRLAAEKRKARSEAMGDREKQFAKLEKKIEKLEAERSVIAAKLADVAFYQSADPAEFAEASREHGQLESELTKTMTAWEALGEEIEEIEATLGE